MSEWYYGKDGQQYGPVDEATLKARAATGEIAFSDLIWKEGMEKWLPMSQIPELSETTSIAAAPVSPSGSPEAPSVNPLVGGAIPLALPTSGLAIASLVCGILSLIICYINGLFGLPAVICGHMAMKRTRPDSQPPRNGRGMAIAGLICGYIGIAIQTAIIAIIGFAVSNGGLDEFEKEFEKEMEKEMQKQQQLNVGY